MIAAGPTGTEAVTSTTWGVVPTQSTSSPPPAQVLTLTATNNNAQYFKVVNTGAETITGLSYVVAITGGTKTALALTACSIAWTQGGSGTCSGTSTTIGTWSVQTPLPNGTVASGISVTSGTAPAAAGAQLFLRATPSNAPAAGVTFTLNTTVSSGPTRQIRAARTTNS